VALASVVAVTGSLRLQEIERTQGGLPWDWLAFRSPASLLAFGIFVAALGVGPVGAGPQASPVLAQTFDAGREPIGSAPSRRPWVGAAGRVHRILLCGLAAAAFLGGWSLPGVSPAQQDARPALEIAGAIVFMAKIAVLTACAARLHDVAPRRSFALSSRRAVPVQLALAATATLASAGWTVWSGVRGLQPLTSGVLVVVSVVALAALVHRVRHGLGSPAADGHVTPFL
jgi:NADH-quinone oxidoreductase subunit H